MKKIALFSRFQQFSGNVLVFTSERDKLTKHNNGSGSKTLMNFNTASLKTKNDCDTVLDFIADEQDELLYLKVNINHDSKASSESSDQIETDLVKANADLVTANNIIAGMEDGPAKEIQITKQVRIGLRVRVLNERKQNSGVLPLFQKLYSLDTIEHQEATLADQKTQIEAHKATLSV